MERRLAVKNMLMALGVTISTPTLISILNSCSDNREGWFPVFYNNSEVIILDYLVDIFLPKTSVVGGKELNLSQFVDKMCDAVLDSKNQKEVKLGVKKFANRFEQRFNKSIINGTLEEYEAFMSLYMGVSKEKETEIFQMLNTTNYKSLSATVQQEYLLYQFLTTVREFSFLGYYTSEMIEVKIMENL